MMDLFAFLHRRPQIDNLATLAIFIDENAAFVVQKGIYEYSRARAGHYAKVLFREAGFLQAVELSRWRAYPLGLAMITELAEGILSSRVLDSQDARDRRFRLDALSELVLSVFDRYPIPAAVGESAWRDARAELARRLALIALHPPKWAMDIPEPLAEAYFNLMPIHEKLRGRDFPTIGNYLRVTMCNIHDELTKRIDAQAIAGMLRAPAD
jgi:hypothetical protein